MSAGNDREFIDHLQAKEEAIQAIREDPERAYECMIELISLWMRRTSHYLELLRKE